MRLPRVFQKARLAIAEHLILDEAASHYLTAVLRVRNNDRILLFNGEGFEFEAIVKNIDRKGVKVELTTKIEREVESPIQLHLAQGIARGEKMDFIIQKSVELGVNIISPIITERTTVRLDAARELKRIQHWRAIMISSCEQCGRTKVPILNSPLSIKDWLKNLVADRCFLLNPHSPHHKLEKESLGNNATIALLIGPEGGFSDHEISLINAQHFKNLNLGPRILRTETATISALTLMQYVYGDL